MYQLTQVVLVRRDVPLIQVAVQGGHAIGLATFACAVEAQSRGCPEAQHATVDKRWGHPSRLWKGVQNERRLLEQAERLRAAGVRFEVVVEPDEGPLQQQATALATWPLEKSEALRLFAGPETYDLRFEQVPAFKEAALRLVVKQLQGQLGEKA